MQDVPLSVYPEPGAQCMFFSADDGFYNILGYSIPKSTAHTWGMFGLIGVAVIMFAWKE